MMGGREFDFPQGLKPNVYVTLSGTAEAVPFQITFMRPVLAFLNGLTVHAERPPDESRSNSALRKMLYITD